MSRKYSAVLSAAISSLKAHFALSLFTLVSVGLSIVSAIIPPLILEKIINSISSGEGITLSHAILYFLSILLDGVLEGLENSTLLILGEKITHFLRSTLSKKITRLEASTLLEIKGGEAVERLISDVDTLETLFTDGIISLVRDALRIISLLWVIALLNKGLFLILLFILPLLLFYTRRVQKKTLEAEKENRKALEKEYSEVPEAISNIRTIHNLSLYSYMENKYLKSLKNSYAAVEKTNYYDSIYSPVILMVNALTVALVMAFSSSGNATVLSLFGMSVGTAVAVINYIAKIFTPLESMGMEIESIQSALSGIERIDDFLRLKERKIPSALLINPSGDVEISNMSFSYGSRNIFNNFSLSIKNGERVIITGRTGKGKSTLFKLLLGLYEPVEGSVTIGGIRASDIPDSERRKTIVAVEQEYKMLGGRIIDEITLHDDSIRAEDVERALLLVGLKDKVMSFKNGIYTISEESLFSLGEWQLIAIARAVVTTPKILLLDEITASLDSETERRVLSAIERVAEGRTVISISHRLYRAVEARIIEI